MPENERGQSITRIVITGGPCAGKTTAMSWIQNAFTRDGYLVLFVDETATQLSSGGAPWRKSGATGQRRRQSAPIPVRRVCGSACSTTPFPRWWTAWPTR